MIMDRRPRWRIADDEILASKIMPMNLILGRQTMLAWQDREHTLRPEVLGLAIIPYDCTGDEGNVELKLTNGRDMLGRTVVNKFNRHIWMLLVVDAQQFE